MTAHIVEAFAAEGRAEDPAVRRGVVWLLRRQEPDGSWFGRWGANYIYGTGAVVPALIAAGVKLSKLAIPPGRGLAGSPPERRRRLGRGPAVLRRPGAGRARHLDRVHRPPGRCWPCSRPGERDGEAAERGVRWLAQTQRADGSWDEPQYTGTGFPGDFYINYHLYRLAFPVSALGRYVGAQLAGGTTPPDPPDPGGEPSPPDPPGPPGPPGPSLGGSA